MFRAIFIALIQLVSQSAGLVDLLSLDPRCLDGTSYFQNYCYSYHATIILYYRLLVVPELSTAKLLYMYIIILLYSRVVVVVVAAYDNK